MAAMGKGVRKAADYSEATSAGAARRRMWLGNGSNGQRRPQGRRFIRMFRTCCRRDTSQIIGGLTGAGVCLAFTSNRTRLRQVRLLNNRRPAGAPFLLTFTSNRTRRRRGRLLNIRRPDGRHLSFGVHIIPHAPAAGAASKYSAACGRRFFI